MLDLRKDLLYLIDSYKFSVLNHKLLRQFFSIIRLKKQQTSYTINHNQLIINAIFNFQNKA